MILEKRNHHERDDFIIFDPVPHVYTILTDPKSKYTSVTTWIHSHFKKFDADQIIGKMMSGKNWNKENRYWGMTAKDIKALWDDNGKKQSQAGTDLHYEIECFNNGELTDRKGFFLEQSNEKEKYTNGDLLKSFNKNGNENADNQKPEWGYFLNYIKDHSNYIPYRTEWMVYHEKYKLSGSIDMVYEDPTTKSLWIYDWKRCKDIQKKTNFHEYSTTECICHIPDTNYWHYAIQLNTYKRILEEKYEKQVTDLYLVILHPNNSNENYMKIQMPDLSEEITVLLEERLKTLESEKGDL
jgi:hypothetical protein